IEQFQINDLDYRSQIKSSRLEAEIREEREKKKRYGPARLRIRSTERWTDSDRDKVDEAGSDGDELKGLRALIEEFIRKENSTESFSGWYNNHIWVSKVRR
ncbi:hypothetical protein PanWU01x14_103370, partial [Parasponia andersonii]